MRKRMKYLPDTVRSLADTTKVRNPRLPTDKPTTVNKRHASMTLVTAK